MLLCFNVSVQMVSFLWRRYAAGAQLEHARDGLGDRNGRAAACRALFKYPARVIHDSRSSVALGRNDCERHRTLAGLAVIVLAIPRGSKAEQYGLWDKYVR
jgi:hypothetical protein